MSLRENERRENSSEKMLRYDTKAKLRPKVKMCEKIGLVIEKANVLRTSEKMAVNLRVCFEGINLLKITIGA